MVNKRYKIGNLIFKISSPVDYKDEGTLSLFLTNEEKEDFKVNIELVDKLPQKIDNPIYASNEKICTEDSKEACCYFKNIDSFGKNDLIYARKRMKYGEDKCTISILEYMQDKICERVILIFLSLEELLAEKRCVIFHSSYINLNGKAIIFTGPCGMGKSTQANLWNKYRNTPIINGDKTLLYEDNKVFMAGGLPISGSSVFCENVSLPIGAIIKLGQSRENMIKRLTGFDAFNAVMGSCYPVTYSKYLINKEIDFAEKLSANVPVFYYECLPNESAVDYLEEMLCQVQENL